MDELANPGERLAPPVPSSWILFVMFFEAAALFGARFAVMISPTRASISPRASRAAGRRSTFPAC